MGFMNKLKRGFSKTMDVAHDMKDSYNLNKRNYEAKGLEKLDRELREQKQTKKINRKHAELRNLKEYNKKNKPPSFMGGFASGFGSDPVLKKHKKKSDDLFDF